jgi:superfamily II DNA or RNA helicase/diadenosine tetraphosphate (Ap4A) HIT family hydrolase/HKD family nuclease/SOS-response transcriptional repressor LexA
MQSPFLLTPPSEWIVHNELAFAVFDRFPVSPGHALVVTRRLVPTWFDATADEQAALMELVNSVRKILDNTLKPVPDGYNVGFNCGTAAGQTVPHVHIHVIPRYSGDLSDPRGGVRNVIPHLGNYLCDNPVPVPAATLSAQPPAQPFLATGAPESPLWAHLESRLQAATSVDVLSSFVQRSGLDVIGPQLLAAAARGASVRILVSDYLGISDPRALRLLLAWQEMLPEHSPSALQVRLLQTARLPAAIQSFHPKAWLIQEHTEDCLIVGSSNLSRPALLTGIEWNLLASGSAAPVAAAKFRTEFRNLWQISSPLDEQLIAAYEAWIREHGSAAEAFTESGAAEFLIAPRPWQVRALHSLQQLRQLGFERALVAVATGMGKTWLAALDALQLGRTLGRRPRLLVVAHRAQILAQAEAALAAVLDPVFGPAETGWFLGSCSQLDSPVVIASVQKLARPTNLELLASQHFDYAIIDEVHHAHAPTWRQMLSRLRAGFTLGLTATPERSDGVDVAALFDDNLACHASIADGIAEDALVPFHYIGIRDTVNFANIPWRNGRFDPSELEIAVSQSARMERLWQAMQQHPADRTLVFCCSRRHALFTRDWLLQRGLSAAAVFSGGGSDSIGASLMALRDGSLQCLCAVDLFNEGLDLPAVDRIIMLRPTESRVVFLQQLGRGLRASPGKSRLLVLDFVGNHRIFASRLLHILALGNSAADWKELRELIAGRQPALPPGCLLDVDIAARDLLRELLPTGSAAALEAYRRLCDDFGTRPTAADVLRRGYRPRVLAAAHGSWFAFVESEGGLSEQESACTRIFSAWFRLLETCSLHQSWKMVVLQRLLEHESLLSGMNVEQLGNACRRYILQHEALRGDLANYGAAAAGGSDDSEFISWWRGILGETWLKPQGGRRWFRLTQDRLTFDLNVPDAVADSFLKLTQELVDWRLADYNLRIESGIAGRKPAQDELEFVATVSHVNGRPILFLPTLKQLPQRPVGPTLVNLPNGSRWVFRFVQVACNVAGLEGDRQNQLGRLLKDWFGADAGLPGTRFQVQFRSHDGSWYAVPLQPESSAVPGALPASSSSAAAAESAAKPEAINLPERRLSQLPAGLQADVPAADRYVRVVPVWNLTAAAGRWSSEQAPEIMGWVEVPGQRLQEGMFVGRVTGHSMEPTIPDGSWCLFRRCPAGRREGRVLLVQLRTEQSPDDGGRFTVKRYHSEKRILDGDWQHTTIQLQPLNRSYPTIDITPETAADVVINAEFVCVIEQVGHYFGQIAGGPH